MGSRGYLTVLRYRGVPVRLHWTIVPCALLLGRLKFVPAFWLGFLLLVLLHEAGHALVVRLTRHTVLSIDVHGIGGHCRWDGDATPIERSLIAWGGVWAQMLVWVVAQVLLLSLGEPTTIFWAQVADVFTAANLWVMAVNLLPIPPLDGAEALKLPGLLWERRKRRLALTRRAAMLQPKAGVALRLQVVERPRREAGARPDAGAIEAQERRAALAVEAMDAVDDLEGGVTPEVEALLNRVRSITAEEGEREVATRAAKRGPDR